MPRTKETRTFRTVEEVIEEFFPNHGFSTPVASADEPQVLSKQIVDALLPDFQKAVLGKKNSKSQHTRTAPKK